MHTSDDPGDQRKGVGTRGQVYGPEDQAYVLCDPRGEKQEVVFLPLAMKEKVRDLGNEVAGGRRYLGQAVKPSDSGRYSMVCNGLEWRAGASVAKAREAHSGQVTRSPAILSWLRNWE